VGGKSAAGVVIQIEVRAGFILWDAGGEQPPMSMRRAKDCEKNKPDFWGRRKYVGVQGADGSGRRPIWPVMGVLSHTRILCVSGRSFVSGFISDWLGGRFEQCDALKNSGLRHGGGR